jgi:hypothetical protein
VTGPAWFDDISIYFDRQGQPIGATDWGRLHADLDYLVVAQHWVRGWMVSTVWLGINHNYLPSGAPLIFETMIFAPKDATISGGEERVPGPAGTAGMTVADLDEYQERYPTEAAAQAGHDRALAAMAGLLGADAVADITGPLIDGTSDSEWDGSLPEWAAPDPGLH